MLWFCWVLFLEWFVLLRSQIKRFSASLVSWQSVSGCELYFGWLSSAPSHSACSNRWSRYVLIQFTFHNILFIGGGEINSKIGIWFSWGRTLFRFRAYKRNQRKERFTFSIFQTSSAFIQVSPDFTYQSWNPGNFSIPPVHLPIKQNRSETDILVEMSDKRFVPCTKWNHDLPIKFFVYRWAFLNNFPTLL